MGRLYDSVVKKFANRGFDEILTSPSDGFNSPISVQSVDVGNSSGAAMAVGWGVVHTTAMWSAGQWDDSEPASYTDDTTDAQDAGASDFALTSTTNDDGFVLQSDAPIQIMEIVVGTAEAGSPVYEWAYWGTGGWTTFTPLSVPSAFTAATHYVLTGLGRQDFDHLATGDTPVDTDGLTAGKFAIRLRATTAPSTAPLATTVKVSTLEDYVESVDDGSSATGPLFMYGEKRLPFKGAVMPYVATADASNWMRIDYRLG